MTDELLRARLTKDLTRDEGLRLRLYKDSLGYQTIGFGRCIELRGVLLSEAQLMLDNDISLVIAELDSQLPWWRTLTPEQRIGLANMAYNLGVPKLLQFKVMLNALKHNDGEAASMQALQSRWAGQVGARAQRIATLFRGW